MKVCVTGANGFIGRHTTLALLKAGHEVLAFDRLGRNPLDVERGIYPRGIKPFLGDVRDEVAVTEAVALADGVIHLAGVLGTAETIDNPTPAVETNIRGSLNVFQACRQYERPCVYITVGNYWMLNSYSITKTTAENLAWMFNQEHGTRIAVVRALNAYGPGQKASPVRKIIPNFILPALRGAPITIYGDGEQVMDMIWCPDLADVLMRALVVDHGQYTHIPSREAGDNLVKFEAGSGRATTVNQIAAAVIEAVGEGTVRHVPMRAGEPERSVVLGNPETLRPLYGHEVPALRSLESGLADTVAWYRERPGLWQ
jgi:nucleoside-diphosphate-sugar epimerase